ncbi:MAG: hypothetical protein IPG89_17855 [Bacteroidetes bacterium]|nr:hypothetical protein [Bacteroidota bacterium]
MTGIIILKVPEYGFQKKITAGNKRFERKAGSKVRGLNIFKKKTVLSPHKHLVIKIRTFAKPQTLAASNAKIPERRYFDNEQIRIPLTKYLEKIIKH